MQLTKGPFNLVKYSWLWFTISILLIATGIFFMVTKGFSIGIDFTGGTSLTYRFETLPKFADISTALTEAKLEGLDLAKVQFQAVEGKDLLMKMPPITHDQELAIEKVLAEKFGKFELLESDTVGPSIGGELRSTAIWIVLWAIGLLLIYITFRFEFWYSLAAILALVHDAFMTTGFASLLGIEINGQFIAAILTILGYSINDTIVIFDRMRENFKLYKGTMSIPEITNISLWQTMSRSINTVLTVLIPLFMIMLFGGSTIKDFSTTLFLGIISGSYSSIFIAAQLYLVFKKAEA